MEMTVSPIAQPISITFTGSFVIPHRTLWVVKLEEMANFKRKFLFQTLLVLLAISNGVKSSANPNLFESWNVPVKDSSESGEVIEANRDLPIVPLSFSPSYDECDLLLEKGDPEPLKEAPQRGQLTLDLLTCILKALKAQEREQTAFHQYVKDSDTEKDSLSMERNLLPKNYNKLSVPRTWKDDNCTELNPVQVDLFLDIREVMDFSENDHFLSFDIELISGWIDNRILNHVSPFKRKTFFLSGEFLEKVWTPDFLFEDIAAVNKPSVDKEPKTVVLDRKTGYIKYKSRMLLSLYCDFDFWYFPADSQDCQFSLRSYSYSTKLVNLSYFHVGVYLEKTFDYNFEYQVSSVGRSEVPDRIGPWISPDDAFSRLNFSVKTRRKLSYHMVQTFIPSVLLGVVTWLCFLVPREQSEVRVGVAMTTLLTITAMFASVRASTPAVSYMKAIDIWMIGCVGFIFLTLAGFLVIAWIQRKVKLTQHERILKHVQHQHQQVGAAYTISAPQGPQNEYENEYETKELPAPPGLPTNQPCPIHHHGRPQPLRSQSGTLIEEDSNNSDQKSNKFFTFLLDVKADEGLDHILVFLLPLIFLIFILTFWIWLILASGYNSWTLDAKHNNLQL